jgi:hypothetical protein
VPEEERTAGGQSTVTYAVYSWMWKDDAPIEEIERTFDEMCALGDDIPGIQRATWGRNTADADHARGYTHTMIIIADDEDSVHTYNKRTSKHPMSDTVHGAEKTGVGIFFSQPA